MTCSYSIPSKFYDLEGIDRGPTIKRQALSDRLNQFAVNTARCMQALAISLDVVDNRIAELERALTAAITSLLPSLQLLFSLHHLPRHLLHQTVSPILPMSCVRWSIFDRIITGLVDSGNVYVIARNILTLELQVTSTVISNSRLANRLTPMLIKLQCPEHAHVVIKCAKNLSSSADQYVKSSVYTYPQLERQEQYNLRVELPRRKAAGKGDVIIRNGAVVARRQRTP